MEIGQNTVQIEGKMDSMERNLSKNGIFTYTSPSEELDSVNLRILEELQRDSRLSM
jgi:hypothetical protein